MHKDVKEMNNEEFLGFLMTTSPFGAMSQVFIIEAIRYYSDKVASQPKPEDDSTSVISPVLWHDVALDIKARFEAKYGS